MNIPKAVVFDLGKVLLDFDYTIAARKLLNTQNVSIAELTKTFSNPAEILYRYETGLVPTEDFYKQVCQLTGYKGDIEAFAACFGDIFTPIEPLIAAQAEIKQRGIPTYIFSNTNELAMRHIRKAYPFMNNFDALILSYEHKALKPQPVFYEIVERTTGQKGADILYIDDRPENVDGGKARGWRTILQEDPMRTRAELAKMGLIN